MNRELYKIITATNTNRLEEEVTTLLDQGWEPHGNFTHANGRFYQALVKPKKQSAGKALTPKTDKVK